MPGRRRRAHDHELQRPGGGFTGREGTGDRAEGRGPGRIETVTRHRPPHFDFSGRETDTLAKSIRHHFQLHVEWAERHEIEDQIYSLTDTHITEFRAAPIEWFGTSEQLTVTKTEGAQWKPRRLELKDGLLYVRAYPDPEAIRRKKEIEREKRRSERLAERLSRDDDSSSRGSGSRDGRSITSGDGEDSLGTGSSSTALTATLEPAFQRWQTLLIEVIARTAEPAEIIRIDRKSLCAVQGHPQRYGRQNVVVLTLNRLPNGSVFRRETFKHAPSSASRPGSGSGPGSTSQSALTSMAAGPNVTRTVAFACKSATERETLRGQLLMAVYP